MEDTLQTKSGGNKSDDPIYTDVLKRNNSINDIFNSGNNDFITNANGKRIKSKLRYYIKMGNISYLKNTDKKPR